MITASVFHSSKKRLKSCGWIYSHNNELGNRVYSKKVNDVELIATIYDDGAIEVFIDCKYPTSDDFLAFAEELKKLED